MRIFGIDFAPLNVPLERRLQSAAIFLGAFVLIFGAVLSAYAVLSILLTGRLWSRCLLLVYLAFVYLDNKYFFSVNRPEWLYKFYWQRLFWDYYTGYFPLKVVKTAELDPTRNYLLCTMPHGALPLATSAAFVNNSNDCHGMFPGLEFRPLSLNMNFVMPFLREHLLNLGVCSCGKDSMKYLLSSKPRGTFTGRALMLMVGGGEEARRSKPGAYNLELRRKKGFVKLALQFGTALVPVIPFGETDIYDQIIFPEGSLWDRFQRFVKECIGYTPIWLNGRGFFQYTFGFLPRRVPINIVVGKPMLIPKIDKPTVQDIDKYHAMFIERVIELFEAEKHNYVANHENVFLNLD